MKAMFVEHLLKTKSKAVSLIQHEHMHTATKTDSIDYSQDIAQLKDVKQYRIICSREREITTKSEPATLLCIRV